MLIAAVGCAAYVSGLTRFSAAAWHSVMLHLNPWAAVAVFAVLPLFGFSIIAVYIIIGSKFGVWWGLAVVALLTSIHLVASHLIAKSFFADRLRRYLARHSRKLPTLPENEERAVALLLALIPGLPYFARNYILGLVGLPLRIYFWICLPIYVIRSYVTLALGDFNGGLSERKLLTLAAIYAVKLSICTIIFWRVRQRLKLQPEKTTPADAHP